jgi:hypothetical protein
MRHAENVAKRNFREASNRLDQLGNQLDTLAFFPLLQDNYCIRVLPYLIGIPRGRPKNVRLENSG